MAHHWSNQLALMNACPEAVQWARGYKTVQAAWEACPDIFWMMWFLYRCQKFNIYMGITVDHKRILANPNLNVIHDGKGHKTFKELLKAFGIPDQIYTTFSWRRRHFNRSIYKKLIEAAFECPTVSDLKLMVKKYQADNYI